MILQNQNISMTELFNLIGGVSDGGGTNSTGTLMAKTNAVLNKADQIITKINESSSSSTGAPSGGVQEFTTNGTFIVPAGVTKIWVTACAGGAGGGGTYKNNNYDDISQGAGGNGGEAIQHRPFSVTPGQSISVTIGAGGAGGTAKSGWPTAGATSNPGAPGGNTIIGSLITLLGGQAGANFSVPGVTVRNGAGYGGTATVAATGIYSSGGGLAGGGGSLGPGGAKGQVGTLGGGGGGGNGSGATGGTGGSGYCLIEW